ncbi:hypothetical protein TNCV_2055001 [Trichonephila clavipes]|uniref:Uncharacterized protein n=1 Tax=Trichonephila clavipes TaxID=2585209 RepID=A0A8X6RRT0_TRICX|nr:hypothetical protein TNCV_2055001 [Trichonephila clavipes]
MAASSSFIPTPQAQDDNLGEGHPRRVSLQAEVYELAKPTVWPIGDEDVSICSISGAKRVLSNFSVWIHWVLLRKLLMLLPLSDGVKSIPEIYQIPVILVIKKKFMTQALFLLIQK